MSKADGIIAYMIQPHITSHIQASVKITSTVLHMTIFKILEYVLYPLTLQSLSLLYKLKKKKLS